jgi:tetratricopeptide (TPR) repeat protein
MTHRSLLSKKIQKKLIIALPYCVLGILIICIVWAHMGRIYEDVTFLVNPTADRAYNYGIHHFSEQYPKDYDLNRADYFFTQAARLNREQPYVYHELARIAFLRGNFPLALEYIDTQISIHGDTEANSYYVRGLIEGFAGDYIDAIADYKLFLQFDPHDWAAINDYSWVLLKAGRSAEAASATTDALKYFPTNPWLLNSNATALYEIGDIKGAYASIQRADVAVKKLTNSQWSHAYPGNDPAIAGRGVSSFKEAVTQNLARIAASSTSATTSH